MAPAELRPRGTGQRGTSLLEALLGLAVVAAGMLASAQWQVRMRQGVDYARQQAGAVRIAQAEFEALRAAAAGDPQPGPTGFERIASATRTVDDDAGSGTPPYTIAIQVQPAGATQLKDLRIDVGWSDAASTAHSVRVDGAIAGQGPALALALTRPPAGRSVAPVGGRHAAIPRDAHDLDDSRAVFKPSTAADIAWLFDRRSGRIVARCAGVPAGRSSHQLRSADLTSCSPTAALLLGGRIRFAATPPAADAAREPPLPLQVVLQAADGGPAAPAECLGEAVRQVDIGTAQRPHAIDVPVGATPASLGYASWVERDDRYWRYHCAVVPAAQPPVGTDPALPSWSGRLQLLPSGWTLGSGPGARRVCRYSADTDASGQIDRNAEHRDAHLAVDDALVEQNLLVVDAAQPCPAAAASAEFGGALPWSDRNPATVAHQP